MPACPITPYVPFGPAGSGTRSQPNLLSFNNDARLIWVIVMAALPAKKSGAVHGGGTALSVNTALWNAVIASTIGWSAKPHFLPSSVHGSAPQPPHTEARLSQVL